MSTTPTEPTTAATPDPATPPTAPAPETSPPAQETDWKAEARKWEGIAKANKDASTKLQQIEDAAKTDLEREKERADKAEARAVESDRKAFAAAKGIPASLITGATEAEWEASAAAALEWKGKPADQPTPPAPTPNAHAAGNNGAPAGAPGDIDAQIAEAEKARNFPLAIALKQRKYAAAKS